MLESSVKTEPGTNRLAALEGLRGLAAVVVVIFHALLIFYPAFEYGLSPIYASRVNSKFETVLYGNPLSVVLSGTLAVTIFFALSGFVLSTGFFQRGDPMIIKKLAAKRYIRLMVPALVSILIVWLLLALGLGVHKQVVADMTGSIWLKNIWYMTPNLADAIGQGFRSIFATGDVGYNPVLWTMRYEFVGSFIVFGTVIFVSKLRNRWIIYTLLLAGFFQSWYFAFIGGMILADLYANRRELIMNINQAVAWVGLFFGLIIGGYPAVSSDNTFYATMKIGWLTETQNQSFYLSIAAVVILFSVITLRPLTKFFSLPRISLFGKYTFALYLTHMAVLFTLTVSLYLWLVTFMGQNKAALCAIILSVPVIGILTVLFERYIDQPSIRLSGRFANWLLGLPQVEGVTAYSEHPARGIADRMRSLTKVLRSGIQGIKLKTVTKRGAEIDKSGS